MVDKKSILDAMKLKTEDVKLDNGKIITVSEISAMDFYELYEKKEKQGEMSNKEFSCRLLVLSIVDPETGIRIFDEGDLIDIGRIGKESFMKVSEAAKRLNGLSGDEGNELNQTQEDSASGESQLLLDTGILNTCVTD